MDSVIQPLNVKITAISNNIGLVLRGLMRGDPEVKKQIDSLCTSVINIKADFTSAVASMKASSELSIKSMVSAKNPTPLVKVVAFYVGEVIAAVNLLNNLLKLLNNLLSINTVLTLLMDEINQLKVWLNKKLLWLTRQLNRMKEKIQKNIEWVKRLAIANATLIYLNNYRDFLSKEIENTNTGRSPGINGDYALDGTTWIPYKSISTEAIDALNAQLVSVDKEIVDQNIEISNVNYEKNVFYPNKWKKEEEQDKTELVIDVARLNNDMAGVS